MAAVALIYPIVYSQAYDPICLDLQNPDICRFDSHFGDEPAPLRQYGLRPAYGQARSSRSLRRSGRLSSLWMAKALGRVDIPRTRYFWYWNRIGSTLHGGGPNRITCRHTRQYFGRGARPNHFSHFLDSTPTLNRRYSCAALSLLP